MKLDDWSNVIVSWASFLDPNEKISSIEELSRSKLFVRLLNVLENNEYQDVGDSNELYNFLRVQYRSLELGECGSEGREDTILRATAFLVYCSLHHAENQVQRKMVDLPGWTQLCLTDFLSRLVRLPQDQITRELLFSNIANLVVSRVAESPKETPPSSGTVTYTTSPSADESSQKSSSKKTSRVQKLRNEIEMLNIAKSELAEELDASKVCISKLESTVGRRDEEIRRLKCELLNAENKTEGRAEQADSNRLDLMQLEKLQGRIVRLEEERDSLKLDLEQAAKDREDAYHEVHKYKSALKDGEVTRRIYDSDRSQMETEIERLKTAIQELEAINKEQSDYIRELTRIKDDSKVFSDSQDSSLLLPECLGEHVIDLEVQELKDVILAKENEIDSIKSKLNEIEEKYVSSLKDFNTKEKEYLCDLEAKDGTIKSNIEELRNFECQNIYLSNTLREKDSIIVSMQSSLDLLNEELVCLRKAEAALSQELQTKEGYNQQLIRQIDNLAQVINDLKREMDGLVKTLAEKETQLVQTFQNLQELQLDYESQIEDLRRELELKTEQHRISESETLQLRSAIEYYTQDIATCQSKLSQRDDEVLNNLSIIHKLESDIQLYQLTENNMKSEINNLEIKVQRASDEIVSISTERNSLLVSKTELEKEVMTQLEQITSLKTELEHKNIKMKSLEEQKVKEQLEFNSVIDDLKCSVSELNSTLDRLSGEKVSLEEDMSDLVRSHGQEIDSMKSNLHSLDTRNRNLAQELATRENVITELKGDIKSCSFLRDALQTENLELKSEIKLIAGSLRTVELEHSSCSGKIQSIESILCELRDKESILKEELAKSKEREDSVKAELELKVSVISQLNNEHKSLEKMLADREFDEGILFSKLQAKEVELNQIRLDINKQNTLTDERYKEEINLHIKKIQDLDSTIGKLNNQFAKVNREKEALLLKLDEKESKFEGLKSECECLRQEIDRLATELTLKSTEIARLRGELATLEESAKSAGDSYQEQFDSKTDELRRLAQELETKLQQEQINSSDLSKQLSLKDNLISDLEKQISLYSKTSEEIPALKEALSNKIELIENYIKEKKFLLMDLEFHSKKEELLNSQLEMKGKELEDLRCRVVEAESEMCKLKVVGSEQEQTTRSLYATLQSQNSEVKEKDVEIKLLQAEIKSLNQTLLEKANQPDTLGKQDVPVVENGSVLFTMKEVDQKVQEMKSGYEKKIEVYKTTVKKRFAEKLEDLTHVLQNENTDLKEKFLKERERCGKLQSELWNASDKLLIAQEQNRTLLTKLQARNTFEVPRPAEPLSPLSKARSMEVLSGRNRGLDNFARDISPNEPGSSSSRRSSIRSLPRGMGRVFPAAEEDGEVFDNRNLADLKAGVCNVPTEQDRMSTLQFRNSLCPPHLKSSYPAETQFFNHHREDEIKSGSWLHSASSESDIRKVKVQSSYKRPGPPTPSKNGGRLSLQGTERAGSQQASKPLQSLSQGVVNESFVLKESTNRREPVPQPRPAKPSTPSRLKALFTPSRRDENSPKKRSNFLRRN